MKKVVYVLLLFLSFLYAGCTPEKKFEEYDINPFLTLRAEAAKKSTTKVKLQLCEETPFKWDKMIIVTPYSTPKMIKAHKLDNSTFVEDNLLDKLYQESDCLLLFVVKDTIVKYSYAARVPLDFCYINDIHIPKILSRKKVCELNVHYVNNNLKLVL